MTTDRRISRRTVLKGFGTALALPMLEAMIPVSLAGNAPSKAAPKRLAFVYVPNGVHMPGWRPEGEGRQFQLGSIMQPLAEFKDQLTVLTGLAVDKARANGDGPGDHARAMSAFLTGCQPRKTAGADIKAGVSVDQFAAQKIGQLTKFPSLEIGCEGGRQAGNCDSGYSCAYSSTIAWRGEATPVPKEIDPRAVFDRFFGGSSEPESAEARGRRERFNKSILDFVSEDANRLRGKLGGTDQRKLDEYLSAVREIERRVQRVAQDTEPVVKPQTTKLPLGIPKDYREHIRLMGDMMVLAFQADLTRIGTFVFANEGSNRNYKLIGVPDGHHDLSHHGRNPEKMEKISQINRFHMEQFAYFLGKLKAIREGEHSLLDNCMIVYGSGNGDGNRHNHDDLPVLLVGKGGGTVRGGQHVVYKEETPITNLYIALLDRLGVRVDRFGDSTGKLEGI